MTNLLLGLKPNLLFYFSNCASFSSKKKVCRADFLFLDHTQKAGFADAKAQNMERAVRNPSTSSLLQALNTLVTKSANNLYAEETNPQHLFSNQKTICNEFQPLVAQNDLSNFLQPITEKSENSTIFDTYFSVPVVHQLPFLTNFNGKNSNLTNATSTQQKSFSVPVVHQLPFLTNFNGKNSNLTNAASTQQKHFSVPVVHQQKH